VSMTISALIMNNLYQRFGIASAAKPAPASPVGLAQAGGSVPCVGQTD
jgi:hypothetical protein